jgi:hypothetical protein
MRFHLWPVCMLLIGSCCRTVCADAQSVAAVNAIGLKRPDGVTLTGAGVNIGQLEPSRASVHGYDSAGNTHPAVIPTESKLSVGRNLIQPDEALFEDEISEHALQIAGIMIGGPAGPKSVAPGANLYSAGYKYPVEPLDEKLLTLQYIAKRFSFDDVQHRHIRAINHSWTDGNAGDGPFSGDSRLTLGVDWMASRFDVLEGKRGRRSFS